MSDRTTGRRKLRIAIDTGGTFTDLVLMDGARGALLFHKVPSTPDDPGRALVEGVLEVLAQADRAPGDVELLVHGTTVATNAVLQRRGACTAFITTRGFRDVLHIQRQDRPRMYDLRSRRAEPLVPRSLRFEVTERMRFDGSVQTPLDLGELEALIAELKRRQVEAVAVGFLHSYANPDHEREAGRVLREQLPEATVCLSHELVGEHGEYERFSTCAMNAFVQPVMQRYLERIDAALADRAIDAPLFVMKSNGGVTPAERAGRHCVETILSGPAGGVVAGAALVREGASEPPRQPPAGLADRANTSQRNRERPAHLISADMGGTSFDVAVIHAGEIAFARDSEIAGLAVKSPMLDIHTVGAGGGSIGWIDSGGALRVGPHSAGAVPGPACYGGGGDEPTVTDANLALGRLGADSLLAGGMSLDVEAARRAIHDRIAAPLDMSIETAAEGMLRVVNATMTAAIRKLTVERGHDPRGFALCAFGGAGPLHASALARELGIGQVVIPLAAGVNSAVGLLMSRLREDRVRTLVGRLDQAAPPTVEGIMRELEHEARQELAVVAGDADLDVSRRLGLRYVRQGYELPVPLANATLADGLESRSCSEAALDVAAVTDAFHREHRRIYGFERREEPVELVNVWVSVEVGLGSLELPELPASQGPPQPASVRPVIFDGQAVETPVYDRNSFGSGLQLSGPVVIQQFDATTALGPGERLEVDSNGHLWIDVAK